MKSGCCTICLEPLFQDIQVSQCGHCFHRSCIYRWIDVANACPNCKQHVDASQLTNLYLKPVEIIKEVLNDPTVLEHADPELFLKFSMHSTSNDDDEQTKGKNKSFQMQLIEERIKNTALNTKMRI